MAASETNPETGEPGEDRKKSPEEIAEERIEAARKSGAAELDLRSLGLIKLPASIGQLTQLQFLNLINNELTELPKIIGDLGNLRVLWITNNQMTVLPEAIGRLAKLRVLYLGGNQLNALPPSLGRLTQLKQLSIRTNSFAVLPETIIELGRLEELYAFDNCLTTLSPGLRKLTRLRLLFLHGNPALCLPPEVLGPAPVPDENSEGLYRPAGSVASPASILDYYFRMRGGRRPLNEVRLLLVGRGAAGKTCIVRRLIENRFVKGEPETKGIDIRSWDLQCGRDAVRAHVWDFAGQVITHATHQFFLSHRSVYVLVLTGREDSEKLDAEYWLRLIRAFGTEPGTGLTSPVIVALNKWELAECKVDRNALQEKYPFIAGFVETDCKSGRGIAALNKLIRETVEGMASVREAFPRAWFAIKERLATMKVDYVSYGEFRAQCRQLGESDAGAQDNLARVLHRLSVALNYADDERLREATVLNPHWVTKGIYALSRGAANERGIMRLADVERVLALEKPEMRRYLVELMRRFDLAFPLTEAGDEWLVPQRLPPTQPKLGREWQEPGLTRLRYTYTALPEGIIPRFIPRTYPLSEGHP